MSMQEVLFTSKMDKTFRNILMLAVGVLLLLFFLPLLLDSESMTQKDIWTVTILCIVTLAMLLWFAFDIKYVFKEDHLYLRAGFLFTRIRYEDVESYREVKGLMDVGSGFNLLNSTNAIAILSQKVMLGEVKISPADQEGFLRELEKRIEAV